MAPLKWMLKLPVTSAESGFCPRSDGNLIYSLSSLGRRRNGWGPWLIQMRVIELPWLEPSGVFGESRIHVGSAGRRVGSSVPLPPPHIPVSCFEWEQITRSQQWAIPVLWAPPWYAGCGGAVMKGLSQLNRAQPYLLHSTDTEIHPDCSAFTTCMTNTPLCYWLREAGLRLSPKSGIFMISAEPVGLQPPCCPCVCSPWFLANSRQCPPAGRSSACLFSFAVYPRELLGIELFEVFDGTKLY